MDKQTRDLIEPYSDEINALLNQHIERLPDSRVLEIAWRIGFATLLAEIVQASKMLPPDVEVFLERVCADLRMDTTILVIHGDLHGGGRLLACAANTSFVDMGNRGAFDHERPFFVCNNLSRNQVCIKSP